MGLLLQKAIFAPVEIKFLYKLIYLELKKCEIKTLHLRLTNFINKISICLCIRFTVYKKFYKSCLRDKSKLDQISQGGQVLWDLLKARFRFLCQGHSNKQRKIQSSLCFYRVPCLFGYKTGFPLFSPL